MHSFPIHDEAEDEDDGDGVDDGDGNPLIESLQALRLKQQTQLDQLALGRGG